MSLDFFWLFCDFYTLSSDAAVQQKQQIEYGRNKLKKCAIRFVQQKGCVVLYSEFKKYRG